MIEAVVFDLDGVLVDSEQVWDEARRALVAEEGGRWTDSATTDMLGMSSPEWSRYVHDELGVALEPAEISARSWPGCLEAYERRLPLLPPRWRRCTPSPRAGRWRWLRRRTAR